MGTVIRPELSEKNKYWIERHRYYELKHFCLQYSIWKKSYAALNGLSSRPSDLAAFSTKGVHNDPTARCAMSKAFYADRIKMIEDCAYEADKELGGYILKAVTEGLSYVNLKSRLNIPCGKDLYYDRYRRFFWILNNARN